MGFYLNKGYDSYNEAVNSRIFVDKTMMICHLNSIIKTTDKYLCVSRPRRFGKSMAANMLEAYYGRGYDSKELFSGLKISSDESFEKHLNNYNVIHLTMTDYYDMSVDEMTELIADDIITDIKDEYPDFIIPNMPTLPRVLMSLYSKTNIPFIIIIDEWDCIMRKTKQDEEEQKLYLNFLRNLLKDKPYVALAYMTGILPVKKYGEQSALNMFKEYSMENQYELAEYTGFTEAEVEALCEEYNLDISETQKWYDGYMINGLSVYNPRSVVCAMTDHSFNSYWTKTDTYEALRKYIQIDMDSLREKVERLIAGEKISINTSRFKNNMTSFSSADDVLTLLIHLGYLTYDNKTKLCWIPNNEVAQEFVNCIEDGGWDEVLHAVTLSEKCLKATLIGDEAAVARIIEQTHRENTSIIKYNDENSLSCVVTLSYYTARNHYITVREYPTGDCFADIVFLPRPNETLPAIVVELKRESDASIAIKQIKDRNYPEALRSFSGEIVLVGINYTSDSTEENYKKHTCVIERITKQLNI